ncbi:hypothetical protein K3495_g9429 [Podosphaera aphanis]|nr:hypothetical protein K3495_g9429 [Podosphaera aphanis]
MEWLSILVILISILSFSFYITGCVRTQLPLLRNKRICLLIAHPDDEAMFFAPTLLALTRPALRNHVRVLCFSSGDQEGLGTIRKIELVKSCMLLGLEKETDISVIESREFPDSMTVSWDAKSIGNLLSTTFTSSPEISVKSKALLAPSIDVLITFDSVGISSHPNHISLYHGAKYFISLLFQMLPDRKCPVSLYTLTSVTIFRKYLLFIDNMITMVTLAFRKKEKEDNPSSLLFLSELRQISRAQKAMTTCHKSQMKWYRWAWIFWSRYMSVNSLQLERHPGSM